MWVMRALYKGSECSEHRLGASEVASCWDDIGRDGAAGMTNEGDVTVLGWKGRMTGVCGSCALDINGNWKGEGDWRIFDGGWKSLFVRYMF